MSNFRDEVVIQQHRYQIHKVPGFGFGLAVSGGIDNSGDGPVVISDVIENGPASQKLQINDIVLEVNGISLKGVTHGQAVQLLSEAGRIAEINVRRKVIVKVPVDPEPKPRARLDKSKSRDYDSRSRRTSRTSDSDSRSRTRDRDRDRDRSRSRSKYTRDDRTYESGDYESRDYTYQSRGRSKSKSKYSESEQSYSESEETSSDYSSGVVRKQYARWLGLFDHRSDIFVRFDVRIQAIYPPFP